MTTRTTPTINASSAAEPIHAGLPGAASADNVPKASRLVVATGPTCSSRADRNGTATSSAGTVAQSPVTGGMPASSA